MATVAACKKSSRLDLRMTDEQKRQIELAASINGTTVSQWSISRLMESARRDIAEQRAMVLEADAFDRFLRALEEPANPTFEAFAKGKTPWEQ